MLHYTSELNLFQPVLPNSYVLNTIYTTFDKTKIQHLCLQGTYTLSLETKGAHTHKNVRKVQESVRSGAETQTV